MNRPIRSIALFTVDCSLLAGCARQAPRASEFFPVPTESHFVVGQIVTGMPTSQPAPRGIGAAFPVGPGIVITAGHIFSDPACKAGTRDFAYRSAPVPAELPTRVRVTGDPACPWKQGELLRLLRPSHRVGDLAVLRMRRPLIAWDRSVDPQLRPARGQHVIVGSPRGPQDDRVLQVIDPPLSRNRIVADVPGVPADALFATPSLPDGWSGSPVKAMTADRTWRTFGYVAFGYDAAFFEMTPSFSIIIPLPDDTLDLARILPFEP